MNFADASRRDFLRKTGLLALVSAAGALPARAEEHEEEEVTPPEDLMREHGVLRRVLLIYGEVIRRVNAKEEVLSEPLTAAAWIVRSFIEDYHEKQEEELVFPKVRDSGKLPGLVETLVAQHKAGRKLTERVMELATPGALKDAGNRRKLADALAAFSAMYRPHAAREDTVLFPEIHRLWTPKDYDELGEAFEKREKELFGAEGFEKMVERVAGIEKQFGIYELAQFTPTL